MDVLLDSVWLAFGRHEVLRGAHLRLRAGEITGMLGRNGTGKSCLLKIMIGQLRADNAYLGVGGVHTASLYHHPGLINYLPQFSCHPPDLRLSRITELYGVDPRAFVEQHGKLFGRSDPVFGSLSGGEKRLFEVLLTLAADTRFTLLDEPFSHIMPVHLASIKDEIRRVRGRKGVLITDHQYEHVLELADTLYVVHRGTSSVVTERDDLVRLGYLKG